MDLDRAIFREIDPCGGDVCVGHSDDSVRAMPWPGQFPILARLLMGKPDQNPFSNSKSCLTVELGFVFPLCFLYSSLANCQAEAKDNISSSL